MVIFQLKSLKIEDCIRTICKGFSSLLNNVRVTLVPYLKVITNVIFESVLPNLQ